MASRTSKGSTAPTLRLVLGDQLSREVAALRDIDAERDIVVMAEVEEEADYVAHHKKKLAFTFAAMRHFAEELRQAGMNIRYTRLDDAGNSGSLEGEIARAVEATGARDLICTQCGEYRLDQAMRGWGDRLGVDIDIREDDRFIEARADFARWAKGRKSLRMEYFYRDMRRRTGLLMEGEEPVGGQWNFDADNRKALPAGAEPPAPPTFKVDALTQEVLDLVAERFDNRFGALEPFNLPVTRRQARHLLRHFIEHALPDFGAYQDAMAAGQPTLYHSLLSTALNAGLLGPLEICEAAEEAWREGHAPLNAVEGFIRQIIGWREYVRGLYWLKMPDYKQTNHFQADRQLPDFYWTAETDMRCLAEAITQTRDLAYAHHIQRLMVLGNFALLAGVHPDEINAWFLVVYTDAYEWVQLPNTHGMAIFADGGIMASKPYAASGKYIDRMSDYCAGCRYRVDRTTEEDACPFNALYWDFMARHRDRLARIPRMNMMLGNLDRFDEAKMTSIRARAAALRDRWAPPLKTARKDRKAA